MTEFTIPKRTTIFAFAAIAFLVIAAVASFFAFDQQTVRWLYKLNPHWNYRDAAILFKYLGKAWLLVWLILFGGILTGKNRTMVIILLSLLAVFPIVQPLKTLTQRQRPRDYIERVIENENQEKTFPPVKSWSFPSGDTASIFAVAVALSPFVSSFWGFLLLPVCCLIGLLRVVDFAHYPSDVFAGAAAGLLAGWLILKIFSLLPLPTWVDSKHFSTAKIAAFILIPLLLLIKDFAQFASVLGPYGAVLSIIFVVFSIKKKSAAIQNKQN
jgi:membrane-associated phospholipid phosphatase